MAKPWDRVEDLMKSSKSDLVKRLGDLLGMGGDWGLEKLSKVTIAHAVETLEGHARGAILRPDLEVPQD